MAKVPVSFEWLSGCSGCELGIVDLHERLLKVLDSIEAKIEDGGEALDDFLDTNLATLEAMRGFAIEVQAWGASLQALSETAIDVSQGAESPDVVDPAEVARLAAAIDAFRAALGG